MKTFFCCSVLTALAVSASAHTLTEVMDRLERAERDTRSVSFDYAQVTTLTTTRTESTSRGRASFQRPNRFRVEVDAQDRQIMVSDGKNLWFYLPSRDQVIRDSMANWARSAGFPQGLTPFRMDVADMKAKYQFTLEDDGSASGRPVLALTPKEKGMFPYTFRLWVDMASGFASKTELSSDAVRTVVTVTNVSLNPSFPKDQFQFRPPEGTDVVDMPELQP